jgi:hypothetical protein
MILKRTILAFVILTTLVARGQGNAEAVNAYIESYREIAISEMQRTGVPAAIKLAQGILETEAGRSDLVMRSNNHFGIKCKSWWTGEKVYHDDDAQGECFRKYGTPEESFRDHSDFLRNSERYSSLFKLDPTDYKAWAYGLKAAGYATNPKYPQILIKYIEQYNLNDYTLVALGRKAHESMVSSSSAPATTSVKAVPAAARKSTYPSGEFRINDTRVIFAKAGTPIRDIALKYALTEHWIADFNDLPEGTVALEFDQLVFLQRKRKSGDKEFHLVEEGDDLYSISQKYAIRLESLLNYNQLTVDMIPAAGEKLYLQRNAPARPQLSNL